MTTMSQRASIRTWHTASAISVAFAREVMGRPSNRANSIASLRGDPLGGDVHDPDAVRTGWVGLDEASPSFQRGGWDVTVFELAKLGQYRHSSDPGVVVGTSLNSAGQGAAWDGVDRRVRPARHRPRDGQENTGAVELLVEGDDATNVVTGEHVVEPVVDLG
jgi:hypothetical protein